jgi:hypothetical protein
MLFDVGDVIGPRVRIGLSAERQDVSCRESPVVDIVANPAESMSSMSWSRVGRLCLTFQWNKGILHSYAK